MTLAPLKMSNQQLLITGLTGTGFVLFGIFSEAFSRPIEPISLVPGLLLLSIGLGIGIPVIAQFLPKGREAVYLPFALLIAYLALVNSTSFLPVFLMLGLYRLMQVGLVFYFRYVDL
jgi:hypothetical protein